MAISKEILNNKKKKANQQEPLGTIPANNPEHVSAPADFHHPIPPKPILYNSFEEAVNACEQIFLKPGEAHTEFYQTNGIIHCVVGIGNYNPSYKHLYLTDSGDTTSISDQLNAMNEQVILMGKKVDNVYETLTEKFGTLQEAVNKDIDELNSQFNDLSTNVNNQLASMQIIINQTVEQVTNISEKVDDISVYVDGFDERIQQNTDDISALTNRVEEIENWKPTIDNSINQLKIKTEQLDSSIIELHDLINEFKPIDTSSIRSLFHDDIWTVNLCCYTAGGHIEIFDDIAGEKWGGDSSRVAECTPFNEYKTYVNGDDVSFMAVPNEGYKFVRWYENGNEYADASIISLVFNNSDIPVIGTLNTEIEPKILNFGYTALFKKLHKLNCKINQDVNNKDASSLTYFDDAIKVIIKDVDENPVEYIIDKDFDKNLYFDDDASIYVIAMPSQQGHHTFEEFIINGTEKLYEEQVEINHNNKDINILAKFEEWWIKVSADANPTDQGEINYQPGYYLFDTSVSLKAIPNRGYIFTNWADENISDEELQNDIIVGNLSTPDISLYINNNIDEYEIRADFDIKKCIVKFYNSDDSIIDTSIVNFGTLFSECKPEDPSNPEHPTYDFIGWTIKGEEEIIVDEYIIESDVEFKAKYEIPLQPEVIAYGVASSSKTIDESKLIGDYSIVNGRNADQVEPFGLKFGSVMQDNKNYIEIKPISNISIGDTMDVSVYQVDSDNKVIDIKIVFNNNSIELQSEPTNKSKDTGVKYLTNINYTFTENVSKDSSIYLGYINNNDFRIHAYKITKNN